MRGDACEKQQSGTDAGKNNLGLPDVKSYILAHTNAWGFKIPTKTIIRPVGWSGLDKNRQWRCGGKGSRRTIWPIDGPGGCTDSSGKDFKAVDVGPQWQTKTNNGSVFRASTNHANVFRSGSNHGTVFKPSTNHENVFRSGSNHGTVFKASTNHENVFRSGSNHGTVFKASTNHENVFRSGSNHGTVFKASTNHEPVFAKATKHGSVFSASELKGNAESFRLSVLQGNMNPNVQMLKY